MLACVFSSFLFPLSSYTPTPTHTHVCARPRTHTHTHTRMLALSLSPDLSTSSTPCCSFFLTRACAAKREGIYLHVKNERNTRPKSFLVKEKRSERGHEQKGSTGIHKTRTKTHNQQQQQANTFTQPRRPLITVKHPSKTSKGATNQKTTKRTKTSNQKTNQ